MSTRRARSRSQPTEPDHVLIIAQARAVLELERWMAAHDNCVAGYVARYGDSRAPREGLPSDGGRHGAGGQLAYAADAERLREHRRRLRALVDGTGISYERAIAVAHTFAPLDELGEPAPVAA
jgi:hypothetical protein